MISWHGIVLLPRFQFTLLKKGNVSMKTRLEWFVVPCVATMFAGNALTLRAQEEPKEKKVINVVVNKSQDDIDAKSIREKVAKELEKSGISDDLKAKILKSIEATMSPIEKKAKAQNEDKAVLKRDPVRLRMQNPLVTQLLHNIKGESYRIGVQCLQISEDDAEVSKDAKLGLEVQAVVDDSPAKKAGIEEGDVLLTVNATKITNIEDLSKAVQEAGKKEKDVAIELKRDDKTMTIKVTPTKMKSADVELENIQLALPTEGFVMDENTLKSFQELKKLQPSVLGKAGGQAFGFQVQSDNLKKEMDEMKAELSELKKMIGDLTKAINEKK